LRNRKFSQFFTLLRQYGEVYNRSFLQALRSQVISPLVPAVMMECYRSVRYYNLSKIRNISFFNPELLNGASTRWRRGKSCVPSDIYDRVNSVLFENFFQQQFELYRFFSDKYGYTTRHPLLDKRILEFCMGVPPEEVMKDGWKRSLFRRALKGVLPEKVRLRKCKSCFSTPYVGYIRSGHSFIQRVIDQKNSTAWDFVDRGQLQAMNDAFLNYPEQVAVYETAALRMAKAVNVAAFIQWVESGNV